MAAVPTLKDSLTPCAAGGSRVRFVILATHAAETCPTSNSKTRDMFLKYGPEIPNQAKKAGVKLLAGPLVNMEHMITTIVEAEKAEAVNAFLSESRLGQWNSVRIIPSQTLEEGLRDVATQKPIF